MQRGHKTALAERPGHRRGPLMPDPEPAVDGQRQSGRRFEHTAGRGRPLDQQTAGRAIRGRRLHSNVVDAGMTREHVGRALKRLVTRR